MTDKKFVFIHGNNGATYILNTSSHKNLKYSLNFYSANNTRQRIVKLGLYFFSFFKKKIRSKNLKSNLDVCNYLLALIPQYPHIDIDDNVSVLISPPRNKIIIHHHESYYHKIGFGENYKNVKNESLIYKKLLKKTESFQLSSVFDVQDFSEVISFKMSNVNIDRSEISQKRIKLVPALLELFTSVDYREDLLGNYVNSLISEGKKCDTDLDLNPLRRISIMFGQEKIPFGLVHKDFKPWNIQPYNPIHIFDFEDAVIAGLPLEDLFNFFIDPIIRYKKTSQVVKVIYDKKNIKLYNIYLNNQKIGIKFEIFLLLYLYERCLFWKNKLENFTSKRYQAIYENLSPKILMHV